MKLNIISLCALFAALSLGSQSIWAADQAVFGKSSTSLFDYTPPLRGAPTARIGTGTRGGADTGAERSSGSGNPFTDKNALTVELLAPNHPGLTLSSSPTIYWYISAASPGPMLLQVGNQRQVFPILEHYLPAVSREGIYSISFAKLKFKLEPELDYRIQLTPVDDSKRPVGSSLGKGVVRYLDATPELQRKIDQSSPEELAILMGQQGIWYDMISQLSKRAKSGSAGQAHQQRAHLLQQAGLQNSGRFGIDK